MRKLYFTWALNERVKEVKEDTKKIKDQQDKLYNMVEELKDKIKENLHGVVLEEINLIPCSGCYQSRDGEINQYHINNRMSIIISKTGRKSTWNDVYKVINSIQATRYILQ